jgi:hypothetical protein
VARRTLLPLLLGTLLALTGPVAIAAAEGESSAPPMATPGVPDVGAAVAETVGGVTEGAQHVVESVTQPVPAATAPPAVPPSGQSGGGQPARGGPAAGVTHATGATVADATGTVTQVAAGVAGAAEGASSPPPAAADANPPAAVEPIAAESASAPAQPAEPTGGPPGSRRRAPEPRASSRGPALRGTNRLARFLAPLLDPGSSAVSPPADLTRAASSFAAGIGAQLTDLAAPLTGTGATATAGSRSSAGPAIGDARVADSSSLPSLLDPSKPASMLFFFLVLAAGAALLTFLFRHELLGSRGLRLRRRH